MLPARDRDRIDSIGLSRLSHHGGSCCGTAKVLLLARLNRHVDLVSRLAAVPALLRWGPTTWPHHWCDLATEALVGDCGVHADLVSHLLTAAGVPHSRGRAALTARPAAVRHWRVAWARTGASVSWLGETVVHHEVVRIGDQWWDPTEARWFTGLGSALGNGRVLAVREEDGGWLTSPEAL